MAAAAAADVVSASIRHPGCPTHRWAGANGRRTATALHRCSHGCGSLGRLLLPAAGVAAHIGARRRRDCWRELCSAQAAWHPRRGRRGASCDDYRRGALGHLCRDSTTIAQSPPPPTASSPSATAMLRQRSATPLTVLVVVVAVPAPPHHWMMRPPAINYLRAVVEVSGVSADSRVARERAFSFL